MKLQTRPRYSIAFAAVFSSLALLVSAIQLLAQGATTPVPVRMTVTADVPQGKQMPEIKLEDVLVKLGKERLKVTEWVPAKGDRAGLELFIAIDEASDTSLGSQLDDLRTFVMDQAPTTLVGIGYMRNATVQLVQNFTRDHEAAAKAIRLPLGTPGAYGSPFLSAIDIMKRWPQSQNRRQLLMITDGIDRARRVMHTRGWDSNPDVDSASAVAQRTGTVVYAIYSPGIGRMHRTYFEALSGQLFISELAEETGGEAFYLGLERPVSFKPYLDDLERYLNNQYWLSFLVTPGKKAGPQYVKITTELAGVELDAADSVWVPAAK